MKNEDNNLYVYSFYRFVKVENKNLVKYVLDDYFKNLSMRGTILIADEGINASISGRANNLLEAIKLIKKKLRIRKLNIKINKINFLPFNRMKVRLKKEIVSLGRGKLDTNKLTGKYVHPSKWNETIKRKNMKVIDTRNIYEINIGKFQNAINPKTNSFREFPEKLKKIGITKSDNLALYCTGGIRCEKASAYLKLKGFKNIFQLEGGILSYLKHVKEKKNKSLWNGECFVFDNRVTVNKNLKIGKYYQCHGCRHPITDEDKQLKSYEKGISCKHCIKIRTLSQKKSSASRQKQISLAEEMRLPHTFKKIT